MKKLFCFILYFGFSVCGFSQAITFSYLTEFATQGDPLAIAADSNGGIYYTIFTFDGPNLTRCYYVADPLNSNDLDQHVLVSDGSDTDVTAGRGFTGVAVDAQGNVFLCLESGNNDTATVRKLSPAPDFQPVDAFFGGIVPGGKRYNGVEVVSDTIIALTTFNTLEFWDANDAAPLFDTGGGEAYQRDVAFNPNTNEFYMAKNGSYLANSANRAAGGTPDNLEGYSIESAYITQGGVNSQYGSNGQLIEYDAVNDLIILPDYSEEQAKVAMYHPDDTTTPVATVDGTASPNDGFTSPSDIVAVQSGGDTLLFVTDNGTQRILVFTSGTTSVEEWSLF